MRKLLYSSQLNLPARVANSNVLGQFGSGVEKVKTEMVRKTASRLQKRKEAEAIAKRATKKPTKKKTTTKKAKVAKKKTKRKKVKLVERRRLIWAIYNGNMKEEARFPYEQRKEADAKLKQLQAKGKRLYFLQPVKEVITDPLPETEDDAS